MEQERFDAIVRALARRRSRRHAVGALLGPFSFTRVTGRQHSRAFGLPPSCDPGLTFCSGVCVDLSSDYLNCSACGFACPSFSPNSYACIGAICTITGCAIGFVDCGGGSCVDLSSDDNNCGACGNVCTSGPCFSATCTAAGAPDNSTSLAGGGGNAANAVSVGDTWGPVWLDGGDASNSTTIAITADGGTAIADAGGGSGNVAVDKHR